MNRVTLIEKYKDFLHQHNLTPEQVTVSAGGSCVLFNVRVETTDIDIDVPDLIFNKFKKICIRSHYFGLVEVLEMTDVIDAHKRIGDIKTIIVDGVGTYTVEETLKMKMRLNRPKDQEDIKGLIKLIKKEKDIKPHYSKW